MKLVIKKQITQISKGTIGNIISIDPGIIGTGYAIWSRKDLDKFSYPIDSGCISTIGLKLERDEDRLTFIVNQLSNICKKYYILEAAIELPKFMEGGKGIVSARSGDLIKLTLATGAICGMLTYYSNGSCYCSGSNLHLIPISKWKGNLSKEIMEERVLKFLPKLKLTSGTTHELDAVGLGLYMKGLL